MWRGHGRQRRAGAAPAHGQGAGEGGARIRLRGDGTISLVKSQFETIGESIASLTFNQWNHILVIYDPVKS